MTDADFFDVYIIYYIFAMEKSLPGIIILLSDDRVFSFQYLPKVRLAVDTQVYTLEFIIFSYDLSLKFLRRFDDFPGIHNIFQLYPDVDSCSCFFFN